AASMRISVPSLAATYALAATIAGAKPGPPLPTACCHSTRGVTVAVSCGIGPGLWPPPVSQANDGTGGIQDDNGDCIRLAHPAQSSAPASVEASVRASRIISPLRLARPAWRVLRSRRWARARAVCPPSRQQQALV